MIIVNWKDDESGVTTPEVPDAVIYPTDVVISDTADGEIIDVQITYIRITNIEMTYTNVRDEDKS